MSPEGNPGRHHFQPVRVDADLDPARDGVVSMGEGLSYDLDRDLGAPFGVKAVDLNLDPPMECWGLGDRRGKCL